MAWSLFCFRLVCQHLLFSYKAINILNGYISKDDTDRAEQNQAESEQEVEHKPNQGNTNQTSGKSTPEASKKEGNPQKLSFGTSYSSSAQRYSTKVKY